MRPGEGTVDVGFSPQLHHPAVPVEVIDWSELMTRMPEPYVPRRQRARFNQLIICTAGRGGHQVDFSPIALEVGSMTRIRPGQVQQFETPTTFEARMVIWPVESQLPVPGARPWFPGSATPSTWQLTSAQLDRVLGWVDELDRQQDTFDGSKRRGELMRMILGALLLVLDVELCGDPSLPDGLPQAYIDLREQLELDLAERPTAASLAKRIGYSTRTLDRACQAASGQTARQIIDERIALEIRRHLADTTRSIAEIRADLGYDDSSNFARFVVRHLGQSPADFRRQLD